ncbi:Glyoxalase/bleomycin resistance protein/dioxygenase-like protein [Paraphoma chrysanthemicola]|nr:Glyoxalase/bleomycin resistance protein/dioxygenase-like protein [Paraphoma chrysanthemicola]
MPLDHVALFVPHSSFTSILAWYDAALAPLGYKRKDFIPDQLIGMSCDGLIYDFWIHRKDETARPPVHFAFKAKDHAMVRAFWDQGIKAGGEGNGEPGIRSMYHEHYFAAYVKDPCGNSIEVVVHTPE